MARVVLYIRNIPCKVLEPEFRDTMRERGLDESRYEVHFPKRARPSGRYNNFGYGFVACNRPEDAEALTRAMDGFRFENIDSSKQLLVEVANRNTAALPMGFGFADDQQSASDAVRVGTPAMNAWGSSTSFVAASQSSPAAPDCSESTRMSEQNQTLPVAYGESLEWSVGSGLGPDASEMPATRLAASADALAHEPSRMASRFQ
eukprot:TRINITY_DN10005_c0_g2_i3.p1 TRINITY_DN10005_c0_g2~~TRINITY_DN10005_c0_g2_i3.p1  ORF type:complete len:223 (-),score=23.50 TRINITY_DN10005_c0_g2_i3:198-809(-)